MKKKALILALIILAVLIVPAGIMASGSQEEKSDDGLKVALILDQRRGDQGLIDRLCEGALKAEADFEDVEVQIIETRDASEYEDVFRSMTKEWGADLIVTVFEGLVKPAAVSAKENPNVKYAMIFGVVDEPGANVLPIKYKDAEAYYISGVMAGMRTKTGKIAFTAGFDIPNAQEAYVAYVNGAKSVRSDLETIYSVVGSFEDPAKGKEVGASLISQGYDVICGWSGKSDWGVAEACQENGNAYITGLSGIMDLRPRYGAAVIGQSGVDFGVSTYDIISELRNGVWNGGEVVERNISTGDVGMHWVPTEADGYTADQIKLIIETEKKIGNGEIIID
jgi:basic membrane protein A